MQGEGEGDGVGEAEAEGETGGELKVVECTPTVQ